MFVSMRNRVVAGLVAGGLVVGSSVMAAAPASADPGDATALGASAAFDVDVAGIVIDLNALVGEVVAAGTGGAQTSDEEDYTLVDAALADITVGAVSTAASSDGDGAEASAEIADVDASLLGLDLLTVGAATAVVTCPTVGAPTATATLAGLTLLGDAAELTAGTPEVSATAALGADVGGVDLSSLDLTITVTRVETQDDTGAVAIALLAIVTLDGTLGATVIDSDVIASITLAAASCEPPLVVPVTATQITPPVGPTTGGQAVTITGAGFTDDTTVAFGGNPATDVVVNAEGTSLTARTPAGPAGPVTVTVANPGSSADLAYTYVEPAAATLDPATGPEYGGTTVTITGQGLDTTSGVEFGGEPATIISVNPDGTQIVVTSPAGTGTVDVTLTDAEGNVITAAQDFSYVPVSVGDVYPDSGPSAGGSTVTITGEGLGGTTGVTFDGNPGTIVGTPTDTEIVVITPAGAVGAADVVIQVPGEDVVVEDGFTYTTAAPLTASGLTPGAGPTGGGQTVTITGTGFTDDTTVSFGPNAGTDVLVNDDGTSLTVVTPSGTAGETIVTVATPGDTATLDYTYVAPTVSNISPASGPVAGGTTVVITGTGLASATDVLFDGVAGTIVGTPSDTRIVVTTPAGAAGPADVVIVLPGEDAGFAGGFVYVRALRAVGITPGQGPAVGGTEVVVDGDGFVAGATTVTVCGVTIPASEVRVNAAGTQLRFTTPACAEGLASVVVSSENGTSDPLGFRYTTSAGASTGGGALASTGLDAAPLAGTGLGLLLLGLLTAFVIRRRNRLA
jgi:hypothetical protein